MSARRFDSPLRYLVESHTRKHIEHVVDLEAYGGNGACSCEHFSFRLEGRLKHGAESGDHLRCHHIKEARESLADAIIAQKALKEIPAKKPGRTFVLKPREKMKPRKKK